MSTVETDVEFVDNLISEYEEMGLVERVDENTMRTAKDNVEIAFESVVNKDDETEGFEIYVDNELLETVLFEERDFVEKFGEIIAGQLNV